jgi:hypothetical protein
MNLYVRRSALNVQRSASPSGLVSAHPDPSRSPIELELGFLMDRREGGLFRWEAFTVRRSLFTVRRSSFAGRNQDIGKTVTVLS